MYFPVSVKAVFSAVKSAKIKDHSIFQPYLFHPDKHFFTLRNGDTFNINGSNGKITFRNSMQKGYEMIYDVYK